jgi:hypothetical protein
VSTAGASAREALFWELAAQLIAEPGVTRNTMMGYPCLRSDGAFFACVERATGHLIVKLPARRVAALVAVGRPCPSRLTAAPSANGPRFGRRPRRMAGAAGRSPGIHRWLRLSPGSRPAPSPSLAGLAAGNAKACFDRNRGTYANDAAVSLRALVIADSLVTP